LFVHKAQKRRIPDVHNAFCNEANGQKDKQDAVFIYVQSLIFSAKLRFGALRANARSFLIMFRIINRVLES